MTCLNFIKVTRGSLNTHLRDNDAAKTRKNGSALSIWNRLDSQKEIKLYNRKRGTKIGEGCTVSGMIELFCFVNIYTNGLREQKAG